MCHILALSLNCGKSQKWSQTTGPSLSALSPVWWVKHLYGLVDELNDTETEMIGMKPKDAIKIKEVPLVARESYPPEEVLPEEGL